MSTAQPVCSSQLPPPHRKPQAAEPLEEIMAEVAEAIAPVWPLKDYVAVNPYAGISRRTFMDARAFLKVFSDCEMLMPIEHYAEQFREGRFSVADIASAISELKAAGISPGLSASQIAENLLNTDSSGWHQEIRHDTAKRDCPTRPLRTVAEYATSARGLDWSEAIVEEISKHCSAHYDQGQSTWPSPHQHKSLYQAWRTVAEHDLNIEILGLTGFRSYVSGLPLSPEAAIVHSLQQLNVPGPLWSAFLLCQAFSIPGWSAWAKYQSAWTNHAEAQQNDLTGLLAIRLAYDAALASTKSLQLEWPSRVADESVSFNLPRTTLGDNSVLRYTLLRASEIGYRQQLLKSLSVLPTTSAGADGSSSSQRKLAQMVFCIDVRSERIRRQLESHTHDIETYGFAGFFGMAFEFIAAGESSGNAHLPVLLKPQFTLHEGLRDGAGQNESRAVQQRQQTRSWRTLWKMFQSSAVGCFSFVETTGLFYGWKLVGRSFGRVPKSNDARFDGLGKQDRAQLGPTLRGLNQQGISTSRQADLAEGMLRNLGLTRDFAQLVVFCGHASQTVNNPLAAGLDCGACGGHSGEPNARFAALLLNQPYIRQAMFDRGIEIPEDTHFLGAVHNTTTDAIEFFDMDEVPAELRRLARTGRQLRGRQPADSNGTAASPVR